MAGAPICAFGMIRDAHRHGAGPGRGAVEQNGENGTYTWYEKLSVPYVAIAEIPPPLPLQRRDNQPCRRQHLTDFPIMT